MSKQLKIFLIVSVLVNALLIGWTFGHFFRHSRRPGPPPHRDYYLSQLPPGKAKAFKRSMKEIRKKNRKYFKKIEEVRKQVIEALTAPTFDPKLFIRKLNELHAVYGELKEPMAQSVAELASTMNQEQRRVLAKLLEKGPLAPPGRQWKRGKRPWKGPGHPPGPVGPPPHQGGPPEGGAPPPAFP